MRIYKVYMEDTVTGDCFSVTVPAGSEDDARKYVNGNGEIIAVKDTTGQNPISIDAVADALHAYGFGQIETDIITRTLHSALTPEAWTH